MLEVSLNTDLYQKDAKRIHLMSRDAFPAAVRYTLDEMAVKTWKAARGDLPGLFTLRNTWTARSIAFTKVAPGRDIGAMFSETGSREGYMREQEEGISRTAKGNYGEPIPTTEASGEGQGAKRKKRVLRKHYVGRLRAIGGVEYDEAKRRAGSPDKVLPVLIAMARKRRAKVIFWKGRRKQGLFLLQKDRLPMLYDLTERRITSAPRPWLTSATDKTGPLFHKIYGKALRFQLYKLSK